MDVSRFEDFSKKPAWRVTRHKPRVLLLTHRLPYPPDRGDRIRSFHMLRSLLQGCDVSLACFAEPDVDPRSIRFVEQVVRQLHISPMTPWIKRRRAATAILQGDAITPSVYNDPAMVRTICRWHEAAPFDTVIVFCTAMASAARQLLNLTSGRVATPRVILDLVDVDSQKWCQLAKQHHGVMRWVYGREGRKLIPWESGRRLAFNTATVISENEANVYGRVHDKHSASKLEVLGNGVDGRYFHPLPDLVDPWSNLTMLFTGVLNYGPNVQGLTWFIQNVLPKVRHKLPAARLLIVGRHPGKAARKLGEAEGVELIGSVPDVRTFLARAAVVIAPLRIAPGVQNKVLEAMACERAVVCSTAAAAGIDAEAGTEFVVAESSRAWSDELVHLLSDAAARQRIATAGLRCVEARYSWTRQMAVLRRLIEPPRDVLAFLGEKRKVA